MQTVVLAAGRGTRMHPLTDDVPKPMLPVAGRPLVSHIVTSAVDAGASRIVVVVGYEGDNVREYVGDQYAGVPVEYAVQEERRGTAHAVRAASEHLTDDPFVVLNGDVLYDQSSLATLFDSPPAIGSYRVDTPENYGVLVTEGERRVTGIVEKPADPPSNLVNAGAYAFPAVARRWLDVAPSERGELELTDVFDRVCREFDVRAVPFERWLDVGRPWELLAANEWKLEELDGARAGDVSDDAHLRGNVHVAPGATIEPGVVVEGPVYVGEGATVGPNAYVRGATYIGPDVSIGHAVEVKNSVVMAGTNVSHLSYVGDSVLGREVNFGAGTNVANLRHDGEPVRTPVKGDLTSTGRRKFGVVCGDRAKTGINTSLNPGVKLGVGARTRPGEVLFEDRGVSEE